MTPLYLPTTDDRSAFAFCFLRRLLAFFPLSGLVPLPAAVAATIRRQVNRMTSRTVRQSGTRRTHAHSADRLVERGRVLRENTPPNDQTPCIESQLGQKKKNLPRNADFFVSSSNVHGRWIQRPLSFGRPLLCLALRSGERKRRITAFVSSQLRRT